MVEKEKQLLFQPGYQFMSLQRFLQEQKLPNNFQKNDYLIEPWNLEPKVIKDLCALWINYPHNPTGKTPTNSYFEKLISWCQTNDVILLSDECYTDLYDSKFDEESQKHHRPSTVTYG